MKPKAKSKSTKLSPAAQKARKTAADTTKQINSLLQQSRTALEDGELQAAHDLASKACSILSATSTNTHPIELLGEINIELENFEPALQCFTEAIRRRENVDPESFELGEEGKFLWMGQLDEGDQAEKWYTKGAEILQHLLEKSTDDDQRKRIRDKLCSTYCSLIELFLTDLCMTDGAEQKSEEYASLALKYDPDSPVALYLLASIRLSQSRNDEAAEVCKQSLSKWLGNPSAQPPTYAERISLVKILLELDMYDEALSVLETLQREDDENVDLWYFYTCAYYHDTKDSKEESWKNALECAETCLKLYQKMEWDDDELRKSCEGVVETIRANGISVDKDEIEGNEDDEEDWEDSDDDVEMKDAD